MERLEFEFSGGRAIAARNKPVLSGVLGSGNLEVLVEPALPEDTCRVEIETAAGGFGEIWKAVVGDVLARWQLGGIRISINDAGATPAVVALRLEQALKNYAGERQGDSQ